MNTVHETDVAILGAGPAGLAAALRLRQLDYRVALVDKADLPRPNIGESLTPGVPAILASLEADDVLAQVPQRATQRVLRCWESTDAAWSVRENAPHIIVDRSQWDLALLELARSRGVHALTGVASVTIDGTAGAWWIETGSAQHRIRAKWILDARGRRCARDTVALAPPLLALWTDLPHTGVPEVRIEAAMDGWLWGAPLPNGAYRLMAFCDPRTRRAGPGRSPKPGEWLSATVRRSQMFRTWADDCQSATIATCGATPYLRGDGWLPGCLTLGDAAFAVDPISSSGVEKAMRYSLQAVAALHTVMTEPGDASMAHAFLQERLIETAARHAQWTERTYAGAWPAKSQPFWLDRSVSFTAQMRDDGFDPLRRRVERARVAAASDPATPVGDTPLLETALFRRVRADNELRLVDTPCLVDDRVRRRAAISHPRLTRPVAFVDGVELAPLLASLRYVDHLHQWLDWCTYTMPRAQALGVAGWLLHHGLIVADDGARA
ncbi:tryptophan 7-halogenase [Paucibacter sp. O1-1]|nr:tryptophan 7-halogenase [Paucibacter sp. O1-1]MDA3830883.1 tryptophan 7-halogenase [Paucibacter sp. O1-1]